MNKYLKRRTKSAALRRRRRMMLHCFPCKRTFGPFKIATVAGHRCPECRGKLRGYRVTLFKAPQPWTG